MTIRPRMDQKPRPLHYFVPGQVVLHVTRSAGASDAEIIEQVGKQVSDAQRGVEVPGEFVPRFSAASKRIVSQSVVGDGARRATVVVDLGYGKKPEDIAALVADVNRFGRRCESVRENLQHGREIVGAGSGDCGADRQCQPELVDERRSGRRRHDWWARCTPGSRQWPRAALQRDAER